MGEGKRRIPLLDEARGFAILCMVGYHFLYDLRSAGLWEGALLASPVMDGLRDLFAGLFVAVAGACCLLSRNNWRRGGICILAAEGVAMAAGVMGFPIWFGVLHLLGSSMLLAALGEPLLDKIRPQIGFGTAALAAVLTAGLPEGRFWGMEVPEWLVRSGALYPLGLAEEGFRSTDYFPFLPWGMVFFAGFFAGKWIMAKGIPPFAMKSRSPFLAACGRKTLLIYLVHQPVLVGALAAVQYYSAR